MNVLYRSPFLLCMHHQTRLWICRYLTLVDRYTVYQIFYLMGATVLHATIGFAMYDCDMMTGDCSFGEYLPWDGSIREIHKEVGLPYGSLL